MQAFFFCSPATPQQTIKNVKNIKILIRCWCMSLQLSPHMIKRNIKKVIIKIIPFVCFCLVRCICWLHTEVCHVAPCGWVTRLGCKSCCKPAGSQATGLGLAAKNNDCDLTSVMKFSVTAKYFFPHICNHLKKMTKKKCHS